MQGKTHFITGSLISAAVASTVFKDNTLVPYVVGGISAVSPDLDLETSLLPNVIFNFVSKRLKPIKMFRNSDIFRKFFITTIMTLFGLTALKFNNGYLALMFAYIGIYPYTKHRTLSHSLLSLAIIGGLAFMGLPNNNIAFYILTGYAVHLLEDTLTNKGIPHLYPFIQTRYRIPLMSTGSWKEYIIIAISIVIWFSMLYR